MNKLRVWLSCLFELFHGLRGGTVGPTPFSYAMLIIIIIIGAPVQNSIVDPAKDDKFNDITKKELIRHSLLGRSKEKKSNITKTYYKFLMYRNPAERLVSAYLDKIALTPMVSHSKNKWYPFKVEIYKHVHPRKFKQWKKNVPINITFIDFVITYIEATGRMKNNDHFRTTFDLCSPCQIRYSYYGNFKFFDRDVDVFNDRIHGSRSNVRPAYNKASSSVAPDYYRQITDQQKKDLINMLARDFLFYYTLFPAEQDSHKAIMGIDYDIPTQEILL